MNTLVLLKQVPANLRVSFDARYNIERDLTENMLNPADKSALYTALRLRDRLGGRVSCLTMGPASAADCLREAAIQGADALYHICDRRLIGADSYVTAMVLERGIQKIGGADLILCGQKTVDGETGQVGPELSHMMDFPCLTNATEIVAEKDGTLFCRRMTEKEEQLYQLRLPAVVAVCSMPVPNQLPSLTRLREARKKTIQTMDTETIGLPTDFSAEKLSLTRVIKLFEKPDGQRRCCWLTDADALGRKIGELVHSIREGAT